jgi:hypothetical protein
MAGSAFWLPVAVIGRISGSGRPGGVDRLRVIALDVISSN